MFKQALFAVLLPWLASATEPVATLTAGAGVTINGKPVQTTGAPNWPLGVGDEVATGAAGAFLTFPDGTRLTMAPQARLILQQCDRCVAQLFEGSVDYSKAAGSKFEFCALGHPVKAAPGTQGSVVIEGPDKVVVKTGDRVMPISSGKCSCNAGAAWGAAASGLSTPAKVAIVAAATGAGAGTAIAVTRPPKKSKDKDKDKGNQQ